MLRCPRVAAKWHETWQGEFVMAGGIVLIVAGILIALYPPLLSIIVATLLILAGVAVLSIAHYNKKLQKHYDNPAVDLFFRF